MRHKKYIQGGYGWRTIDENGGEPIGRVRLFRDPLTDTEAATRNYVNSKLDNLNANAFTKGTLSSSCIPAFTGELLKEEGNSSVTLSTTGVTPGNYSKVQVDAKGRVIVGKLLENTDLPALPFSKFTEGKPTTAGGYGITDNILNVTGSTFTGDLKLDYNLTDSDQYTMVNKDQVETALEAASYSKVPIGGIIESTDGTTPTGFLRANGGVVSKTTYSDLYSVIGDRFNSSSVIGAGKPWEQQALFNDTDPGDLTWAGTGKDLAGLYSSTVVVTKNRVYSLGGYYSDTYPYNNPTNIKRCMYAPINSDGTLGNWINSNNDLPIFSVSAQAVVTKNRVYLLGGFNENSWICKGYTCTATIESDGTLGTWEWNPANNLPMELTRPQAIVTKNRVYLVGSISGTEKAYVIWAPINEDGTLGTWVVESKAPFILTHGATVITKNRVYIFNNNSSIEPEDHAKVYTASINGDGTLGMFSDSGVQNFSRYSPMSAVTGKKAYIFGGHHGDMSNFNRVSSYNINLDGTISYNGEISKVRSSRIDGSNCWVVKNYIYIRYGWGWFENKVGAVDFAPFTGGKNDYSEYYNSRLLYSEVSLSDFQLPMLDSDYPTHIYSYIRYE